ncbi:hypothetical protein BSFA1_82450 (plasmid) [Burkholderia sp. SFA1]|nr:hypothetical protein BSFA1_82450 [Burkholderia sp. SFA1]
MHQNREPIAIDTGSHIRFNDRGALALFALDDKPETIRLLLPKDAKTAASAVAASHWFNVR